jgi:hypothetical protein
VKLKRFTTKTANPNTRPKQKPDRQGGPGLLFPTPDRQGGPGLLFCSFRRPTVREGPGGHWLFLMSNAVSKSEPSLTVGLLPGSCDHLCALLMSLRIE